MMLVELHRTTTFQEKFPLAVKVESIDVWLFRLRRLSRARGIGVGMDEADSRLGQEDLATAKPPLAPQLAFLVMLLKTVGAAAGNGSRYQINCAPRGDSDRGHQLRSRPSVVVDPISVSGFPCWWDFLHCALRRRRRSFRRLQHTSASAGARSD